MSRRNDLDADDLRRPARGPSSVPMSPPGRVFPGFIVPKSAEVMLKMFDVNRELRKQFPNNKDFDRERRK